MWYKEVDMIFVFAFLCLLGVFSLAIYLIQYDGDFSVPIFNFWTPTNF